MPTRPPLSDGLVFKLQWLSPPNYRFLSPRYGAVGALCRVLEYIVWLHQYAVHSNVVPGGYLGCFTV